MKEECTINDVISYIRFMKESTPEELRMIYFDVCKIFLMSLYKFGFQSFVTKDCINIAKEFTQICRRERYIFNYIVRNIDNMDIDRTYEYLEMLDKLNERTYLYYDTVIYNIEYALYANEPRRANRIKKEFEMLTDTDRYMEDLENLTLKKSIQ